MDPERALIINAILRRPRYPSGRRPVAAPNEARGLCNYVESEAVPSSNRTVLQLQRPKW